jgi:ACS family glucarate transporter-like MFS transporter
MASDTPTTMSKQVSAPAYTGSLWTGKRFYIVAFLFFNMFINYMDRINLSVAAPTISKMFKWDSATMGWIFSCYLFTYMICLIPWGRVTDRYGSRSVGAISMVLWSLGGMASGATVGFASMLAARLGLGIGEAASFPICGKVVRQWFPASERGLATAIFNAGTFAGPALSAPFVAWLVLQTGWRMSFVITGAMGILWAILWYAFFRNPAECTWLPEGERNYLLSQTVAPAKAGTAQPGPTKGALGLLLSRKTMWGQFITQGCCAYTMYLFLAWLPSYLVRERHMDLMKASWFTAMPYLLSVVFGILIGKLSDSILTPEAVKQGKRRQLLIVFILLSSVVLLTNLVSNQWVVVVLIAVALTSISSALTLNIAMCNDLVWDPSMAATALGFQILGGNSLGFLAPILTGYIVKATGSFNSAFILAGCLLFVGATTSLTMTRKPLVFGEEEKALAR